LNDDFYAIRITRVADEKPARDALDDDAANTGCSFSICKLSVEVDQKAMT
jgi:hypothetical protein